MTNWQWRVILALCRVVLEMCEKVNPEVHPSSIYLLREALERGELDGERNND